jgi:hypothetical protein
MLAKHAGKPLGETLTTERKTGAAFPSPFKFKQYGESGLPVSEIFAKTAEHADEIAVIRSMHAEVPNHEPSLMLMNCGDSVQALVFLLLCFPLVLQVSPPSPLPRVKDVAWLWRGRQETGR